MAPMNWLTLYIIFTMIFLLFYIFIFFNFFKSNLFLLKTNKKSIINYNWKW